MLSYGEATLGSVFILALPHIPQQAISPFSTIRLWRCKGIIRAEQLNPLRRGKCVRAFSSPSCVFCVFATILRPHAKHVLVNMKIKILLSMGWATDHSIMPGSMLLFAFAKRKRKDLVIFRNYRAFAMAPQFSARTKHTMGFASEEAPQSSHQLISKSK